MLLSVPIVIQAFSLMALSAACASLPLMLAPPSANEKVKPLALAKNVRRFMVPVCKVLDMI
jgi:hypothetical protein